MENNNIPQGYKSSSVGVIPSDWEVRRTKDVLSYIGGGAFSSKDATADGVRWVKIANVGVNKIKWDDVSFLPSFFMFEFPNFVLKSGDVVVALTRPILDGELKIAILKDSDAPSLLNQRVAKVETKGENCRKFFYYAMQLPSFINKMEADMLGTDPPNASFDNMYKQIVLCPPLVEQERIAEVLGVWDRAIELQGALIDRLTERKRALMQQLLTAKKRLPQFSAPWQKYRYSDILKEVKRKLVWDDDELYKLISVKRRSGGLFERESLYGHQIKTKNLRPAHAGDFLISKMQIVHGASGLTTAKFDNMKISGSYIALVASDPNKLCMEFLDWWSKMPYFYHQTYISSYGVHIEKMTFDLESFMALDMMLPTLEEQKAIAQILSTADREITLAINKQKALTAQKRALMQQLLTGKKRLKI